jgi:hypothetical protein
MQSHVPQRPSVNETGKLQDLMHQAGQILCQISGKNHHASENIRVNNKTAALASDSPVKVPPCWLRKEQGENDRSCRIMAAKCVASVYQRKQSCIQEHVTLQTNAILQPMPQLKT